MTEAARWIDLFLEAQAAELGAAKNTLLAYARDLKDFSEWVENQGLALQTLRVASTWMRTGLTLCALWVA
ncbi:site-specific integrase, partial [Roseovarius mucosus]|uniref:site-specific integrase n=1 Tax=Roseovarius mucosus TaxID=215743 RepID=UPI003F713EAE